MVRSKSQLLSYFSLGSSGLVIGAFGLIKILAAKCFMVPCASAEYLPVSGSEFVSLSTGQEVASLVNKSLFTPAPPRKALAGFHLRAHDRVIVPRASDDSAFLEHRGAYYKRPNKSWQRRRRLVTYGVRRYAFGHLRIQSHNLP